MITLPDDLIVDERGVSDALQHSSPISSGDRNLLLAELLAAGKSNASLAEKLAYLNTKKPYQQTPPTWYADGAALSKIAGAAQDAFMAMPADHPAKAQAAQFVGLANARTDALTREGGRANLTATATQTFRASAIALGLLTAQAFDAAFTIPPNGFETTIWETPASHVLGARVVVEEADIS